MRSLVLRFLGAFGYLAGLLPRCARSYDTVLATAIQTVFVAVAVSASVSEARAELIDICQSEHGGVLVHGSEVVRDGSFDTFMTIGGQSGSMEARIDFDQPYHVDEVRFKAGAATYAHDGGARAWAWLDLFVDGNIENIGAWGWATWQSGSIDVVFDNDDEGWNNVTGVRSHGYIEAFDTGSAVLHFHELQAWAVPEPASIFLLVMVIPVLLICSSRCSVFDPTNV